MLLDKKGPLVRPCVGESFRAFIGPGTRAPRRRAVLARECNPDDARALAPVKAPGDGGR